MKNKNISTRIHNKNLTEEQIKEESDKRIKEIADKEAIERARINKLKEDKKKDLNKLSTEQKKLKKIKDREEYLANNKIPNERFPYIDELTKAEHNSLLTSKLVYSDPGKRAIYTMTDDNDKMFTYTSSERMHFTKRLVYQTKILNFKKKNNIIPIETELSELNSKTCDLSKFEQYITKKNEVYNKLKSLYQEAIFRQLKWYTYINTQRENSRMIQKIIDCYGEDIIIIMGDWSTETQMRGYISTPNISIKRVLVRNRANNKFFIVYNLDEFRTSCLYYKTEERMDNLYLPDKRPSTVKKYNEALEKAKKEGLDKELSIQKNKVSKKETQKDTVDVVLDKSIPKPGAMIKMHSILTSTNVNNRMECINRDRNSVYNMRKIVKHYLKTGKRLDRFKRGFNIDPIKDPTLEPILICGT